jgi:ABC-type branched-subunit amino acid transport system substrate-binding protein
MASRNGVIACAAALLLALATLSSVRAQDPIKIGVIVPLAGPSAAIGQEDLKVIQFARQHGT